MSNTDSIRWRQRFENFGKAYHVLEEAMAGEGEFSCLERAGVIQFFECAFELSWKTLKDWLFEQGFDEKTPRDVIRRSFEVEIFSEADTGLFLEALHSRNELSHMYDEELVREGLIKIGEVYVPMLGRLYRRLEKMSD